MYAHNIKYITHALQIYAQLQSNINTMSKNVHVFL